MQTVLVYSPILASFLFIIGSLSSLQSTKWKTVAAPCFLAGSVFGLLEVVLRLFQYSNDKEKKGRIFSLISYLCYIIASILFVIDIRGTSIELLPIILYIIGGGVIILKRCMDNSKYGLYVEPIAFTVGGIMLLPNVDQYMLSGLLFLIGSVSFLMDAISAIDDVHIKNEIITIVLLICIIESLLGFESNINWFKDDHVSEEYNYIAFTAVMLGITNNIPQLVYTYNIKEVTDFSIVGLSLWLLSSCFWFSYGLILQNYPLVMGSSISLFSAVFLLMYHPKFLAFWIERKPVIL